MTGATYAVVFRHATRSEDPVTEGKRSGMGTFTHAYSRFAHLDIVVIVVSAESALFEMDPQLPSKRLRNDFS